MFTDKNDHTLITKEGGGAGKVSVWSEVLLHFTNFLISSFFLCVWGICWCFFGPSFNFDFGFDLTLLKLSVFFNYGYGYNYEINNFLNALCPTYYSSPESGIKLLIALTQEFHNEFSGRSNFGWVFFF